MQSLFDQRPGDGYQQKERAGQCSGSQPQMRHGRLRIGAGNWLSFRDERRREDR